MDSYGKSEGVHTDIQSCLSTNLTCKLKNKTKQKTYKMKEKKESKKHDGNGQKMTKENIDQHKKQIHVSYETFDFE